MVFLSYRRKNLRDNKILSGVLSVVLVMVTSFGFTANASVKNNLLNGEEPAGVAAHKAALLISKPNTSLKSIKMLQV
jgi:hypothetical protein